MDMKKNSSNFGDEESTKKGCIDKDEIWDCWTCLWLCIKLLTLFKLYGTLRTKMFLGRALIFGLGLYST